MQECLSLYHGHGNGAIEVLAYWLVGLLIYAPVTSQGIVVACAWAHPTCRLSHFLRVTLKNWEWPGDEAKNLVPSTLDHDFHLHNVVQSVTFVVDIPKSSNDLVYEGKRYVRLKTKLHHRY